MLVRIHKVSDTDYEKVVEINSMQELKNIQDKYNNTLIINFYEYDYQQECNYIEILIYDDYIE